MIDKQRLIKLTQDLIKIDSQNPGSDEARIAVFVKCYLEKLGLRVKTYEFKKRRTNVVARMPGKNKKHSLLITPHLDTVPAGANWNFDPFAGRIYKGNIYGLGATDCKGNLAVAMEAMRSLIEEGAALNYELIFAATAEEESGSSLGLIPLLEKGILRPDAALVLDADDFEIIVSQKGLLHFKIKIQGKKAHGAYPWLGRNAIDICIDILKEIKEKKFLHAKDKYLKGPTVNIGTIKGGDKVNVVADWCEAELDFRFLPGMRAEDFLKEVKSVIKKYTRRFNIEIEGIQKPYRINERHNLVKHLSCAIKSFALKPKIQGSDGATTITFFQNKNIPAIATGFGREGCAHCIDEYAKVDNLYKGSLVLNKFLREFRF